MSRLASSRFRRRAGWLGALVAVAGAVALIVVLVGNTGHTVPQRFEAGKPQVVPPAPKRDVFTAAERREVRAVAARFVESAVYRRHVDDSWAITTARLHQGISRADWASGEIPVVPYSADAVAEVRWQLDYSYAKDVALKVAFYPKPGSGAARQIFEIELENHGTDATPNWLVSYWAPSGGPQLQSCAARRPEGTRRRGRKGPARRGLALRPGGTDLRRPARRDRLRRRARAVAPHAGRASLQLEDEPLLSELEPVRRAEAPAGGG